MTRTIEDIMAPGDWLMGRGERAALEGMLATLKPSISIEVGIRHGGSLRCISAHSGQVHAFDLKLQPTVTRERFPNVEFHVGDSHRLLPIALNDLAALGASVDFALVDGDHSAEGVRRDVEALLASPSVSRTIVMAHDTLHPHVRAGLERIGKDGGKVTFVDLDFVQGVVASEGEFKDELWGGLGLIVVGWELGELTGHRAYEAPLVYEAFVRGDLDRDAPLGPGAKRIHDLERELAELRECLVLMERSWSWRLTMPLRRIRRMA